MNHFDDDCYGCKHNKNARDMEPCDECCRNKPDMFEPEKPIAPREEQPKSND
jgi:hypothetical protein